MKNRKLEITLLTVIWVVVILTFGIDVWIGLSREDIFKFAVELLLLSLWTFSVVKRRPTK